MPKSNWTQPAPIWSSRPTAHGIISAYSVQMWQLVLIGFLFQLNAIVWGSIGIYEAARLILS